MSFIFSKKLVVLKRAGVGFEAGFGDYTYQHLAFNRHFMQTTLFFRSYMIARVINHVWVSTFGTQWPFHNCEASTSFCNPGHSIKFNQLSTSRSHGHIWETAKVFFIQKNSQSVSVQLIFLNFFYSMGPTYLSATSNAPPVDEYNLKRNPLFCYLCNQMFQNPCLLACYHTFCAPCLKARLKDSKIQCPMCG